MTSSLVFWPEITLSCWSSTAFINLQTFMPLAFCTFIPFQIPHTLRANVFPVWFVVLNFAVVKRYICCALTLQNVAIVLRLDTLSRSSVRCVLRAQARREAGGKGTCGGETQPQCMLGRGWRWQRESLTLLWGLPADAAGWHQQRQLVTSDACHGGTQGTSARRRRHWCGTQ